MMYKPQSILSFKPTKFISFCCYFPSLGILYKSSGNANLLPLSGLGLSRVLNLHLPCSDL